MKLNVYLKKRGRTTKLANDIGVNSVLISQWGNKVRPVPVARCPAIEEATEGRVRCEEMRPDINWSVLRSTI